ncbi:O-antigen ligase family protein [Rodentibacter myodis]|uniref:Ligase n=1 Tax=Rodentibacter myodis TaxID=1907939 RepID=A0A1V3JIK4_9PAST|nr:O-antigen ligase [Rodentibacter myodis]OOF56600.1 ligase [Rodentibacter myodis]
MINVKYHQIFVAVPVFLFFTLLLVFPKGYNYGSTILLVVSVLFLFYALYKKISIGKIIKQNRIIFFAIGFYFLISLCFILFHGEKIKLIDNPLRAFLFLSVIVFIIYSAATFDILLHSIPLGSFIAGGVAIYQYYILHLPSAFYEQMKIQSGDIAMSLGVFSFVVVLYLYDIKKYKLALLAVVTGLFGVFASILSFARGGWIGVPILFLIAIFLYRHLLSKKLLFTILTTLVISLSLLTMNDKFIGRISEAKQQLDSYYLNGSNDVSSVGERLDMWKIGYNAFRKRPVSGWGLDELYNYKEELAQEGIVGKTSILYVHLHNQFIDDLAKKGVLGGFAILGIFIIPLYIFYKKQKNAQYNKRVRFITTLGIIHIVSTMSYCLTQSFLIHNSGNIFYFFLIGLFYSFTVNEEKRQISF